MHEFPKTENEKTKYLIKHSNKTILIESEQELEKLIESEIVESSYVDLVNAKVFFYAGSTTYQINIAVNFRDDLMQHAIQYWSELNGSIGEPI